MMNILRKTRASMAKTSGSSSTKLYGAVHDDLSTWEFVNASQSDDEDLYSFDDDNVFSDGDETESKTVGEEEDEESRGPRDLGILDDVISIQSLSVSPPMTFPVEMTCGHVYYDDGDGNGDGDGDGDEDDDVHDVDDDDDVDDELVPWKLKDRFVKQRIRKMGKRGGSKLNKSKRLPYYYNRPGCLYGKHGFGVQHSFI